MGWRDVRTVLEDPATRTRALRDTVPLVILATALLAFLRLSSPPVEGFFGWPFLVLFPCLMLPLRLYLVASWIHNPPSTRSTAARHAVIWTLVVGSFLLLYFVVLR